MTGPYPERQLSLFPCGECGHSVYNHNDGGECADCGEVCHNP